MAEPRERIAEACRLLEEKREKISRIAVTFGTHDVRMFGLLARSQAIVISSCGSSLEDRFWTWAGCGLNWKHSLDAEWTWSWCTVPRRVFGHEYHE